MLNNLSLNIHGLRVDVRSANASALENLGRDFAFFRTVTINSPALIELELASVAPKYQAPGRAHWRWRSARINQNGNRRTIDYESRALLNYDLALERGTLFAEDPALLHELAYLTVQSRVGVHLDKRGLHRVHALGFAFQGKGGLLLLPSRGGKSRLGLELIKRPGFEILSDDIPLISSDAQRLAAFPLAIGLRGNDGREIPSHYLRPFIRRRFEPKQTLDVAYFAQKIRAEAPLTWLFVGDKTENSTARILPCSATRAAAALGVHLVLGIGTPQVLELLTFAGLAGCAPKRLLSASRAAMTARRSRFLLAKDPAVNAAALESYLSCAS